LFFFFGRWVPEQGKSAVEGFILRWRVIATVLLLGYSVMQHGCFQAFSWEAGKLGSWEAGKLGSWEAGKLKCNCVAFTPPSRR